MTSLKRPGEAQVHDGNFLDLPTHVCSRDRELPKLIRLTGSNLRIAIVHARWNTAIISALVTGTRKALLASSVREQNIVIQDVPGSYELPMAVQK